MSTSTTDYNDAISGRRVVVSLDRALEEYDGVQQDKQRAGSYSGVATILRVARRTTTSI
jgi:hypothetical protein